MERSYLVFIPVFGVLITGIFLMDYAPYIISSHMSVNKESKQTIKFNEIASRLIQACMNTRSDYVIENCDDSMSSLKYYCDTYLSNLKACGDPRIEQYFDLPDSQRADLGII